MIGAAWPYQAITLKAADAKVGSHFHRGRDRLGRQLDAGEKSKHPNCAYMFMAYASTPKVQAQQALFFGETPANHQSVRGDGPAEAGSCAKYHPNDAATYIKQIKFWKTPQPSCGDGTRLHQLQRLAAEVDR